ncbi:DivIVA domain-containing protein [Brevibacterium sp. 50QC2O2]|uniref:DivIVA domain-containing protein n=1 Tax=Brevibacterium TaxID=1696 RepID=UPI00211C95DF|nr:MULTISPECIES: DivIVA domain-containing protein [unclassified Brevibacterium]MCQ9367757.1 DivIVA domain-containing protein [Brevibacterium sp. 91QC2O2]MCQ9384937.1 DivIVA domain-containing protein [Brevibacterium sp. 68QC2CO]MCQ9388016.1 DivIVA domain-containing protein [Brevibacterium sp. 50QC2O2]
METNFPRMTGWKSGYDPAQVDSFFKRARESFERSTTLPGDLDARAVRTVGFDLVRKGYHVGVVDAALDRLEDAFAKRAQEQLIAGAGQNAWVNELTRAAGSLRGRLQRPYGERFDQAEPGRIGYDLTEVDALCDKIRAYLSDGVPMSVDEVRRVLFKTRRGHKAYNEDQVDAFIDRVVEVMASVD